MIHLVVGVIARGRDEFPQGVYAITLALLTIEYIQNQNEVNAKEQKSTQKSNQNAIGTYFT